MAFNEVSVPQYQNLVRRVFGLTGPGGNVPALAPEIQPVVILQPDNPEFRRLRGEAMWSGEFSLAGGAAQVPAVALVNPAGSQVIATIVRIQAQVSSSAIAVTGEVSIDTETNVNGVVNTLVQAGPRDSRFITAGASSSGCQLKRGAVAGAGTGFRLGFWRNDSLSTVTPVIYEFTEPIVITPGFGVEVFNTFPGATTFLNATITWYERLLEAQEATS